MAYPKINKDYAQTKYNLTRCLRDRRKNKLVKYIVIHYTASNACAKNNVIYFGGGNRNASADYFIDKDGTIYKFNANCAKYYSWSCGDGHGAYGIKNSNSIGIEVVSAGEEYTQKQKDALRSLVTAIMADYGVPASGVVRHYDASRKRCPYAYCGNAENDAKWKKLRAYITGESTKVPANTSSSTANKNTTSTSSSPSYDKTPDNIKEVQTYMNSVYKSGLVVDGKFGANTKKAIVKQVQKSIGATADGIFGSGSKSKWGNNVIKNGSSGTLARLCQMMLICRGYSVGSAGADGTFDSGSVSAAKKYQKAVGISADGMIGKNTAAKLFG